MERKVAERGDEVLPEDAKFRSHHGWAILDEHVVRHPAISKVSEDDVVHPKRGDASFLHFEQALVEHSLERLGANAGLDRGLFPDAPSAVSEFHVPVVAALTPADSGHRRVWLKNRSRRVRCAGSPGNASMSWGWMRTDRPIR